MSMKLEFNLTSGNGAVVAVEWIMQKSCGLVLVGEVKSGSISKGGSVGVQAENKIPIFDEVKRIELDHREVTTAVSGQSVGICLKSTTKEDLLKYLGKN